MGIEEAGQSGRDRRGVARTSRKKAKAIENPRQGMGMVPPPLLSMLPRGEKARMLPVTSRKKTATMQARTAMVSSQPVINCHAGRAKR